MNWSKFQNFMIRAGYKMQAFMQGRYGTDQLNRTLGIGILIFWFVGIFIRPIQLIALLLWGLCMYRTFSKNISRRYAENQWYLSHTNKVRHMIAVRKQNEGYRIFTCAQCHQKIRIPKGHGKVEVHCKRCGNKFIKRT